MLPIKEIKKVRDLYYLHGIDSVTEISRLTGYNRKTVTKYIDMNPEDIDTLSTSLSTLHPLKLDPYKPLIDSWLIADKEAPRKERHSAKKIYERLSNEAPGFNCSYRSVALYVAARKKELNDLT